MAKKRRHYEAVPPPGPGARAALYLRYSNPKQNGTTIAKQRRMTQALVETHGWVTACEYAEPETSAKNDTIESRPQFAALLAAAARHEFDVVVVECIDRWGRDTGVFYTALSLLDRANIHWTTATAPIYNSVTIKQEGFDLAFAISVSMAAASSRLTSRKVVDGMRTSALKGYHHSSLPYGYLRSAPETDAAGKLLRRTMIPHPEQFPCLATIAELRLLGWGSMEIGNEVGIAPSLVNRILVNETYVEFAAGAGYGTVITPDGERVQGLHAAAWSHETWARLRQMTEQLYGKPRATAHWHRVYPLAGLLQCRVCGRRMIARSKHASAKKEPGKIYRYYDCYDHDRAKCPAKPSAVPCAMAEDAFGALLGALAGRTDWQTALEAYLEEDPRPMPPTADHRATLTRQMAALDAKLDVGRIEPEAYRRDMRALQAELAALPSEASDTRAAALAGAARMVDVATGWVHGDLAQRQEMATILVQPLGLIWDHATRAIVAIKPHSEFVPGFAVALGWDAHGQWLAAPDGAWEPASERESAS